MSVSKTNTYVMRMLGVIAGYSIDFPPSFPSLEYYKYLLLIYHCNFGKDNIFYTMIYMLLCIHVEAQC